jgi:general secretion pathway protein G
MNTTNSMSMILKESCASLRMALMPWRTLHKRQSGMTLIEIILVVALIGTLMAYLVRSLIGTAEETKKDQTKLAFGTISQGLQLYQIHCNRLPTTEQGLDAMISAPGDSKCWRGPYLEPNKLQDPWGVKFSYESDGRTYKIVSAGPNGTVGDEDDISYPETPES